MAQEVQKSRDRDPRYPTGVPRDQNICLKNFSLEKLLGYKGLEISSCPIKMVDNLSSQVDFLFNKQTKIII